MLPEWSKGWTSGREATQFLGYYQGATQRWPMHGSFFGVVSEGFEVHQLFGPAIFDILPLVVSILTLQRMKAILLTLVLSYYFI
jgi:hypothetical protein